MTNAVVVVVAPPAVVTIDPPDVVPNASVVGIDTSSSLGWIVDVVVLGLAPRLSSTPPSAISNLGGVCSRSDTVADAVGGCSTDVHCNPELTVNDAVALVNSGVVMRSLVDDRVDCAGGRSYNVPRRFVGSLFGRCIRPNNDCR